jgi:hypothetical protein
MDENKTFAPPIKTTDTSDIPYPPALPAIMDLPLMQDWINAVNDSSQSTNREGRELQDTCKTISLTMMTIMMAMRIQIQRNRYTLVATLSLVDFIIKDL